MQDSWCDSIPAMAVRNLPTSFTNSSNNSSAALLSTRNVESPVIGSSAIVRRVCNHCSVFRDSAAS